MNFERLVQGSHAPQHDVKCPRVGLLDLGGGGSGRVGITISKMLSLKASKG